MLRPKLGFTLNYALTSVLPLYLQSCFLQGLCFQVHLRDVFEMPIFNLRWYLWTLSLEVQNSFYNCFSGKETFLKSVQINPL